MVEDTQFFLPIETERLILRRFCMADAEDILSFSSDPSIAPHLQGFPGPTIEEVRDYIHRQIGFKLGELDQVFDLAVELKGDHKVIGLVTLISRKEKQGELGYALNVIYQRKGYATEAVRAVLDFGFDKLDFHRIFSTTERHNINSWMLLERVGMRREAVFLEDHLDRDEWCDSFLYAMLKKEWHEKIG